LDWSYTDESELLTASHSNNIKFWCIDRPRAPTGTLITPLAVSRAKFSPFGLGVVALSNKNVSSSLDLYSYAAEEAPKGPNNISIIQNYVSGVTPAANKASITTSSVACLSPDRNSELASFDWRVVETNGYREYQVLALSKKDHSLRFIPISADQQKACGYEPSAACLAKSSGIHNDNSSNSSNAMLSLSLDQEFSLIKNMKIPNILIEKVSAQTRSLIITAQRGKFLVQVKITFPSLYPIEAPPAFEMLSNISPQSKVKIKEALVGTAQEFVEKNSNCIESCLRKLSILLEQEELSNQTKPAVPTSVSMPTISVSGANNTNLPSNMTNYMVKPFDTLASIALTFGMSIAELRQLNKIHHSSQLLPGQNLIVYKKAPTKGKVSPRGEQTGLDKHQLGVKRSITAVSRGDSRRQLKMSRDDSHISEVKHDPSLWHHAKQKSNIEMKHKLFKPSIGVAAVHKAKVKFIDMSNSQQISSIGGVLTITTTQFIFEPDLDQYAVWERGVLQYTIFNEMTNVISCEVVNSDMFFEDDDVS
jgi:LysM repeat protein